MIKIKEAKKFVDWVVTGEFGFRVVVFNDGDWVVLTQSTYLNDTSDVFTVIQCGSNNLDCSLEDYHAELYHGQFYDLGLDVEYVPVEEII